MFKKIVEDFYVVQIAKKLLNPPPPKKKNKQSHHLTVGKHIKVIELLLSFSEKKKTECVVTFTG